MSIETARVRTKEIDAEQKRLHKKGMPFQLMLLAWMLVDLFSSKGVVPDILDIGYLREAYFSVAFAGLVWVYIRGWKLSREKDAILAKHGIW